MPTTRRACAAVTSPEALVRGLLEPLLDARRQPATEHFDEALAGALAAGRITPELARELRFWQRASVHEVTDHVRTVVPAVLPAALSAVADSGLEADEAAAGALDAWAARQEAAPPRSGAEEQPVAPAGEVASGEVAWAEPAEPQAAEPQARLAADDDQQPGPTVIEAPASTPPQDGAAMSPHQRRRLFVAGLTSTA